MQWKTSWRSSRGGSPTVPVSTTSRKSIKWFPWCSQRLATSAHRHISVTPRIDWHTYKWKEITNDQQKMCSLVKWEYLEHECDARPECKSCFISLITIFAAIMMYGLSVVGHQFVAETMKNRQKKLLAVFSGFFCTFAREAARGSGVVPKPSAQQEFLCRLSNIIIPQVWVKYTLHRS